MGCGTSSDLDIGRPEPLPEDLFDYIDRALERLDKDGAVIPCEYTGEFHGNATGSIRGYSSNEAKRQWFEEKIEKIKEVDGNIIVHWLELDADFTIKHCKLAGADMPPHKKMKAKVQEALDQQTAIYSEIEATVYESEELNHLKQLDEFWPTGYTVKELKKLCIQPEEAMNLKLTYAAGVKRLEVLYEFSARIARQVGLEPASTVTWHVKRPLRLLKKALDRHPKEAADGNVRYSTDVYRTSIAAKTPKQIEALMEILMKGFGRDAQNREDHLLRLGIQKQNNIVVERIKNRFAKPMMGGYMDVIVNVRINGYVCEIQLHLEELLATRRDDGRALAKWASEFSRDEQDAQAVQSLQSLQSMQSHAASMQSLQSLQSLPAGKASEAALSTGASVAQVSTSLSSGQRGYTSGLQTYSSGPHLLSPVASVPQKDVTAQGKLLGGPSGGGRYRGRHGEGEGPFRNGKRHGEGQLYYNSGDRYEGEFMFGMKQGNGTYFYANGDRYKGHFLEDRMHGYGSYLAASGECYEGMFQGGMRHGQGTFYGIDSTKQEGHWWQNRRMTIESV